MLRRSYRLKDRRDVARVYSKGRTTRASNLTVKVAHTQTEHIRVAVVVSKKVAKSAPTRNRIRRRIYEVVRTNIDHIKPGTDMLISVFSDEFAAMPSAGLVEVVKTLLSRAGVYKEQR